MSTQQEFIQQLIQQETKMSLVEFFKGIHERFYPVQDISFMNYFLELTKHEGEFIVHHNKLVEYGIMSSKQSCHVKEKLDALGLVEGEEYLLTDIREQVQSGTKHTKVYMLTPEAFKTCLMRARKYPNQTVDPAVYSKYYLLLEKTYKLYTDYEKQLLNRQLEQKDKQLVQKDQLLEQKDRLALRFKEMLVDSSNIPKTQVVYIATSPNYAQQNRFKVGGVESFDKLTSRLSNYNGRSAGGDLFYFSDWYQVHNYREIENRLKDLLGRFRDSKCKEIYILHYTKIEYIINYLVQNYNEETDLVNNHLVEFISSLDNNQLRPVVPKERSLKKIQILEIERPIVATTNTTDSLATRLETYINNLNRDVQVVNAKQVFDSLEIKTGRRVLYTVLEEIIRRLLPTARMVKF